MTSPSPLDANLKMINEAVYSKCGFIMSNLKLKSEGAAYSACSFELNGYKIEHRTSRTTPAKTGQFVTIWKRGKDGITAPFDISDDIDFVVITSGNSENLGQFIIPRVVLVEQGILSQNTKGGKRGIRVYPPWDIARSMQAVRTQHWQSKCFVTIKHDGATDLGRVRQLFNHG